MLFKIYLILLFICFIIGVISILKVKSIPLYLKLMPWFILVTFVTEVLGGLMFNPKNGPIYNIYAVIEVTFLNFFLYQIIQNKLTKRILVCIQLAYVVVVLVNSFFIQGFDQFNAASYLIGSALLVFFSSYYLYELFFKTPSLKPLNEASFWIALGILLFHGSSCSILLALDHLNSFSRSEQRLLACFTQTLDIVYYSLFIIAFLCIIKFTPAARKDF